MPAVRPRVQDFYLTVPLSRFAKDDLSEGP
jgi:hypothetical protein